MHTDDEEEDQEEKKYVRDAREQLNELLLLVDLPQITHIADATPNLLIALFESLLERRVRLEYRGNTASHAKLRNVTVLLQAVSSLVSQEQVNIDPHAVCRKDHEALHNLIRVLRHIAVLRGKLPPHRQQSIAYTGNLETGSDDLCNITSHYDAVGKVQAKENSSLATLPSLRYHQHMKTHSIRSISSISTSSNSLPNANRLHANKSATLNRQQPSRRILKKRQSRPVFLRVASSRGSNTSFSTISLSSLTSECQITHDEPLLKIKNSTPRASRLQFSGKTPVKASYGKNVRSPMIYPLYRLVDELSDASRTRSILVDSPRTAALRRKRTMALRALQANENVRPHIASPAARRKPSKGDDLAQLERHLYQLDMIKEKHEERQRVLIHRLIEVSKDTR